MGTVVLYNSFDVDVSDARDTGDDGGISSSNEVQFESGEVIFLTRSTGRFSKEAEYTLLWQNIIVSSRLMYKKGRIIIIGRCLFAWLPCIHFTRVP